MNPGLISRKRLCPEGSRPDRGRAPFAAAGLLLAVAVAGVASASVKAPTRSIPTVRGVSSVSYLPGTQVPAPPRWLSAQPARVHGRLVFRPGAGSAGDPASVFDGYLSSMQRSGWTLSAKADPDRNGNWTLRWTLGPRIVLLTYTTSPAERLTIDDCPPEPYC
jgi:hypothetical protein